MEGFSNQIKIERMASNYFISYNSEQLKVLLKSKQKHPRCKNRNNQELKRPEKDVKLKWAAKASCF